MTKFLFSVRDNFLRQIPPQTCDPAVRKSRHVDGVASSGFKVRSTTALVIIQDT